MKHFRESEFKHFDKMDKLFLQFLDDVRDSYGKPFSLHCDFEERQGQHGEGKAVDFDIKDGWSLIDQARKLIEICEGLKLPFRLGAYPYWNNQGFHLDCKNEKLFWILDKRKTYVYFQDKESLFDALSNLWKL